MLCSFFNETHPWLHWFMVDCCLTTVCNACTKFFFFSLARSDSCSCSQIHCGQLVCCTLNQINLDKVQRTSIRFGLHSDGMRLIPLLYTVCAVCMLHKNSASKRARKCVDLHTTFSDDAYFSYIWNDVIRTIFPFFFLANL